LVAHWWGIRNSDSIAGNDVRKIIILPTLLTLGNAVCGFGAIAYAGKIGKDGTRPDLDQYFLAASGWMILAAMVFDAMDGYFARLFKAAGRFGAELDSLCDAISFGAAPAFLLLQLGPGWDQPKLHQALAGVAALYLMCTILRLARYNVEAAEGVGSGKRFRGLPSPAAAGCVATLAILRGSLATRYPEYNQDFVHDAMEACAAIGAALVAILMVSRVSYPHLTRSMLRRRGAATPLLLTSAILLVLAREAALVLLFWGYALGCFINHVAAKVTARDRELAAGLDERLRH
jgi:CDP-diacylglycerol---serine O-phosphatidyltransferase